MQHYTEWFEQNCRPLPEGLLVPACKFCSSEATHRAVTEGVVCSRSRCMMAERLMDSYTRAVYDHESDLEEVQSLRVLSQAAADVAWADVNAREDFTACFSQEFRTDRFLWKAVGF